MTKESYTPPFTLTSKILSLTAEICEAVGSISALHSPQELRLRRVNRIRTVHGSLAIEGNTLSEDQISSIIQGKNVVAPIKEIQEVRNAIKAYDMFMKWEPLKQNDLLKAHAVLMAGLLDSPGKYRYKGVGIMGREDFVHMAPPANRVPQLMNDLFTWLKKTDVHPLVAGSVFHYEFEFIHPFEDGNGRMGRLWQTLILSKWNPLFADIPVESMVYANQQKYYNALNQSTDQANCTPFIEFMLENIKNAINAPQVSHQVTPQVKSLLEILKGEMSLKEILDALKLKDRKSLRERYIKPALDAGLIEMTVPEKPNSRLQRYRLAMKENISL
jgi:Fic family protein